MAVLVTGGAGYIGSHTVWRLLEKNEEVVVVDHLGKGHPKSLKGGKLYVGNLQDQSFLKKIFKENDIEAVIHFAAYSLVGESVQIPLKYYENNVGATIQLLAVMKEFGVKNIVFSSTAAVYGEPKNIPILETDPTNPTNPYGACKLAVEEMLKWAQESNDIQYVSLRYFNAAGAHESGVIGEDHDPESHLIPIVLKTALGQREKIAIFGEDYPTKDGTCVRDYIHVMDLAQAHVLALEQLRTTGKSGIYNLGNGKGFSVKEVIDMAKQVTGIPIEVEIAPRRKGDPAILVASAEKAKKELGWKPKYDQLQKIIEDAWRWHKNNPRGFEDE
ncbi:UDP-glucose 4-epimerase GalE [Clostridiaceae bacterium 35-E11]